MQESMWVHVTKVNALEVQGHDADDCCETGQCGGYNTYYYKEIDPVEIATAGVYLIADNGQVLGKRN